MSALRPGGEALTRRLLAFSPPQPGERLLDLGCGAGQSLALLRENGVCDLTGLEPDADLREQARAANPGVPILAGRGEDLPFKDGSFHLVLAECVVSLLDPVEKGLAELGRVLVPGGRLLLSDVYAQREAARADRGMLRQLYTREELTALLEQAGFRVCRVEMAERELRQMLGQMIFDYGMEEAYARLGLDGCALKRSGVGYLLLLAERTGLDNFLAEEQ